MELPSLTKRYITSLLRSIISETEINSILNYDYPKLILELKNISIYHDSKYNKDTSEKLLKIAENLEKYTEMIDKRTVNDISGKIDELQNKVEMLMLGPDGPDGYKMMLDAKNEFNNLGHQSQKNDKIENNNT